MVLTAPEGGPDQLHQSGILDDWTSGTPGIWAREPPELVRVIGRRRTVDEVSLLRAGAEHAKPAVDVARLCRPIIHRSSLSRGTTAELEVGKGIDGIDGVSVSHSLVEVCHPYPLLASVFELDVLEAPVALRTVQPDNARARQGSS